MRKPVVGTRTNRLASPFALALLFGAVYLSLSTPPRPRKAAAPTPGKLASTSTSRTRRKRVPSASPSLTAARFTQHPDTPASRVTNGTDRALLRPRTLAQTCARALASPVGDASSDGLGHRLNLVLYELNLAVALDVAYLHRVSPYASLTASDAHAVQRLFGWLALPDLRSTVLRDNCVVRTAPMRGCARMNEMHEYCAQLVPDSVFRRVVRVPQRLTDCIGDKRMRLPVCLRRLRRFAERFPRCGTLFQAFPSKCSFDYGTGFSEPVDRWLRARYWQSHAASTRLLPARELQRGGRGGMHVPDPLIGAGNATRLLPFRSDALQIAVHVRRGDLFRYPGRKLIADATYARVIAHAVRAARSLFGERLPIDVSVFSEGAPPRGERVKRSNHDVSQMTSDYVTERGARVEDGSAHWDSVVGAALEEDAADTRTDAADETDVATASSRGVHVRAFIATDTVVAIHSMLCADVFVGSLSGLSFNIAGKLARGVILLPRKAKLRDSVDKRTLYFDADGGDWDQTSLLNARRLVQTMQALFKTG